jgi:hypothetical protein
MKTQSVGKHSACVAGLNETFSVTSIVKHFVIVYLIRGGRPRWSSGSVLAT